MNNATPNTMDFIDILEEYFENELKDGDSLGKWRELNYRQMVLRAEINRRVPHD